VAGRGRGPRRHAVHAAAEPRDLPLARFIDRAGVHYPGIELVADTELSADSDPYLADHLLDGDILL
jgi:enediyne polyketide synthase